MESIYKLWPDSTHDYPVIKNTTQNKKTKRKQKQKNNKKKEQNKRKKKKKNYSVLLLNMHPTVLSFIKSSPVSTSELKTV